jgi:hypothetical protein
MPPINRNLLAVRLDSRLVGYAALTGAALAAPVVADATVVYSGAVNIVIPLTTAGVYLNVETGVNNVSPAAVPGWDVNPFSSTTFSWFAASPNASSGYIANFAGGSSATLVDNLPIGTAVSVAQGTWNFNNAVETTGTTAFNLNSNNNYVGFRFLNGASVVSYGWVQVHLGATLLDPSRAIIGYAYDNAGGAILVGDTGVIPEPSTLALLSVMAAGAVGVRAWRKIKAA